MFVLAFNIALTIVPKGCLWQSDILFYHSERSRRIRQKRYSEKRVKTPKLF